MMLSEVRAIVAGNRAAYGGHCYQGSVEKAEKIIKGSTASSSSRGATLVWVNPSSRIYHCPGTQWFKKTKRGRLVTEVDALTAGNRPSRGRRCN